MSQKVVEAQLALESNPQSIPIQARLEEAEVELKAFLEEKIKWMTEVAQMKWQRTRG